MTDQLVSIDDDVCEAGRSACQQLLRTAACGSIRYFAEVDSTNSAAARELATATVDAAMLPRLYLADRQTAGRGRLGKQWVADAGTLTFSLLCGTPLTASEVPQDRASTERPGWLPPGSGPLVGLSVGVAVARTIEFLAAPVTARIKWPNDVYVGGGKVAGVLVETVANHPDRFVVGIGLNVATDLSAFAEQIDQPADSLERLARGPHQRYEWLPELIAQLHVCFESLWSGPELLLAELRRRCLLTGTLVRLNVGDFRHEGRCVGIDESGSLLIHDGDRIRAFRSGEASQVRGR